MGKINDYIVEDCNELIKYWDRLLFKYGVVTMCDIKDWICDPKNESTYRDTKIGWTKEITTDNFIEIKKRKIICYQLNLPEPKELE